MVAIFTGMGAGFERGSGASLGANGLLGSSSFGRDGQGIFLNAANGNLLVTDQDEFLVGRGPDIRISRTYNSIGALDDNGDRWRQSTDRRVFGLTGTANIAGSTVRRVSADGSEIIYTWNGSFYQGGEGEGANDRLSYSTSSGVWTWIDGDSQIIEKYQAYGTNNWRISEETDSDDNSLAFSYTADKLTRVTTADGGYVDYTWSGSNIASVTTGYTDLLAQTSNTLTRTRYAYDGQNRLVTVTTDLTPSDNSISDGEVYTTQYTYHGSSKLVASISQTDGAHVDITYDDQGRVTQIVQAVASGDSRTTTIEYHAYRTIVTDPTGQETTLTYNAVGQLTKVEAPPAQSGADPQIYEFQYSFPPGNLSAQGVGIVKQGAPSPGGTPVDWTVGTESVNGRTATSVRKPWSYRQPWDGWNLPGSVYLKGGDRPDGSFSVTAGETVGYRVSTHRLDDAHYVATKVVFVDASGNVLGTGGEVWNNAWEWSESSGTAIAPAGAVAAYVEVLAGDWGAESDAIMGMAFADFQFVKLAVGATVVPPWTSTPNLVWGADLRAGASIMQDGAPAPGGAPTPWVFDIESMDGSDVITLNKPWGYLRADNWNDAGTVFIAGGDRLDGSFSVKEGDFIGYRFEAKALGATTNLFASFRFIDADGNTIGYGAGSDDNNLAWHRMEGAVYAPAGAVAAILEFQPAGWGVPSATPMGAALDQLQVYVLPYGASDGPYWGDPAPVGKLLKIVGPDGSETGYSYNAAGNIAAVTDANGNTVSRVYDDHNNLILVAQTGAYAGGVDALYTRYVYDAENHLRYAISAEGQVTEYSYTSAGDLEFTREYTQSSHLYPIGDIAPSLIAMDTWRDGLVDRSLINVSQVIYDDRGAAKETKRWSATTIQGAGIVTDGRTQQFFTYDQAGQLLSRAVAGQQSEYFVYDGMGRIILSTDLTGSTTKIFFDDAASTTVITTAWSAAESAETANSHVSTSVYNKAGELISRTDRGSSLGGDYTNGGTLINLYDKNGQLRRITDATGFATYFLYDKVGRKIADIGHGGQLTEYRYDQVGRLVATVRYTNALSSSEIATLADPNGVIEIASIRPAAHSQDIWQWSVYDAGGRVIETISGDGAVTHYQYDQSDRLVATTGYYNKLSSGQLSGFMSMPPTALVLPTADSRDAILRAFYDRDGRVIGSLNAEGIVSRIVYDGAGQKVQETAFFKAAALNLRTSGTFDELLASVGIDNARDITTRYVYDGQGLLRWTIDALNRVTEYVYWEGTAAQAVGLVRKTVVYADPIAVLSNYDRNTLAAATAGLGSDPDNRVSYNVYNDRAQLSYSVDAVGAVTGFAYDTNGRVIKATQFAVLANMGLMGSDIQWKTSLDLWAAANGADSHVTRSYYSERGELRFAIDAEGYVTQSDYDNQGRIAAQHRFNEAVAATDAWAINDVNAANKGSAASTQFYYDSMGRLADVYDALGVRRTTVYYANGTKQYEIVANGQGRDEVRTRYAYDQAGRLAQTSFAADTSQQVDESYQYDGFGNTLSVTDARNNTTYFTYDKVGRVLTQTNAMNGVTRYGYDAFGRNVVIVDPRGSATYTQYDQVGRAVAVVDPEGYVTTTTYTAFGDVASVTRHANKETNNYLSSWPAGGNGYTIGREAIDGQIVLTARNAVGELPSWHWAAFGGEIRVLPGNLSDGGMAVAPGDTVNIGFDAKALTAGLTIHAKLVFRHADESISEGGWTDVSGAADWLSVSTGMTAPADAISVHVAIMSYRADGNVSGGFDFAVRDLKFLRNGIEHVISTPNIVADPDDATTSFEYDKLGRVVKTTDAEGFYEQYTLDAFGQRTGVRNKLGGWTYNAYDKRGLLVEEALPIAAQTSSGSQQASNVINRFEYDSRGNRTKMIEAATLTEQRTTTYAYDALDRLISKSGDAIIVSASATSAGTTITPTEEYFYDLRGNLIETRDATGARILSWYDKLDRVTHIVSPTGTLTRNLYDANGNVTETRVYATQVTPLPTDAQGAAPEVFGGYRVTEFSYDALNRVIESRVPSIRTAVFDSSFSVSTQTLTTQFEYDAAGNIVRATNASGAQTYTYYDKLGRKTTQIDAENYRIDWSYDSDGNVLEERRYSAQSAAPTSTTSAPTTPTQGSDDRVTTFQYDMLGRRTSEVRSAVKVHNGSGDQTTQSSTIGYLYNALGQVTRKTEATGEYINYSYDAGGRLTMEQRQGFFDFNGTTGGWVSPTQQYYYDGLNNLVRQWQWGATGAASRVTTHAYGSGGRLTSTTDAETFTHYFSYDAAGRLVRDEYDLNGERLAVGSDYDDEGRVMQQGLVVLQGGGWTRSGLDTISSTYNAFGEVVSRSMNGVEAEKFAYDDAGRLWRTTAGDGTWKYFLYDAAGSQTAAIVSTGMDITNQSLDWVLDRWGSNRSLIGTTNVDGIVATITAYDKRNQAVLVREPQREIHVGGVLTLTDLTTTREYNAFGEIEAETNAAGHRIDYTFNTMGRVIKTESPTVSVTSETGVVTSLRPTEHKYYDASGRLVASKDANGNLTRLTLLNGTGYNGTEALVTSVTTADAAVVATRYDIHGDARTITDQIGRVTTQLFDMMGRLTQVDHAGGLVEFHRYDGLGQKTQRWNNLLGFGYAELMSYDRQGRLIQQTGMGGDVTTYAYEWDEEMWNEGLDSFGGWIQTTTHANGLQALERTDYFGHTLATTDLGGNTSLSFYDAAGRLIRRTGGAALNYTYFNTGRLESVFTDERTGATLHEQAINYYAKYPNVGAAAPTEFDDLGYWVTGGDADLDGDNDVFDYAFWHQSYFGPTEGLTAPGAILTQQRATYTYDAVGNLLTERLADDLLGFVYANSSATYDALGRLVTWSEAGSANMPAASITYAYDANSNIRRSNALYYTLDAQGVATANTSPDDDWYRYDSLNRVVLDGGSFDDDNDVIVAGSGTLIEYDNAGQRIASRRYFADSASDGSFYNPVTGQWEINPEGPLPVFFGNVRRESYAYDDAGRLLEVKIAEGQWDNVNHILVEPAHGTGPIRGRFEYDLTGRQINQWDYSALGYQGGGSSANVVFSKATTFNNKSQVTSEDTTTLQSSGTVRALSTYSYGSGSGYALGAATSISTQNWLNGASQPTTLVTNTYAWRDVAVLDTVSFKPDASQGTVRDSKYAYVTLGGQAQLESVNIKGNGERIRTVAFRNDLSGQVIRRDETDRTFSTGDPHEVWHRFGGKQIGMNGNNGATDAAAYQNSISLRTGGSGSGPFLNGATSAIPFGDFNQSLEKINSYNQGSTASAYTVRGGETLSSIAANLWGDASLWWKLADANGLNGQSMLFEGQSLRIPAGVMKSTHTASTFTPYDPADVMGNTAPTSPLQPKPKKQACGAVGQVLLVIIAVAVATVVSGGIAGLMSSGGSFWGGVTSLLQGETLAGIAGTVTEGIVAGAVGGAAGSIASQYVGVRTGIQDKFSWNAVAMAAVAGGVAGSGSELGVGGTNWGSVAARGAVASIITQGIGDATGVHGRFSWVGVAAAGAGAGFARQVGDHWLTSSAGIENRLAIGTASAIGNAAARSVIAGTDFGDNVLAAMPDVIGQTIGEMITSGATAKSEPDLDPGSERFTDKSEAQIKRIILDDLAELGPEVEALYQETPEFQAYLDMQASAIKRARDRGLSINDPAALQAMPTENGGRSSPPRMGESGEDVVALEARGRIFGDDVAMVLTDAQRAYNNLAEPLRPIADAGLAFFRGGPVGAVGSFTFNQLISSGMQATGGDKEIEKATAVVGAAGLTLLSSSSPSAELNGAASDSEEAILLVDAGSTLLGIVAFRRGGRSKRSDRVVDIEGYKVGPHGGMPEGRKLMNPPMNSHHGMNDNWATAKYGGKYNRKDAPAVLLSEKDHRLMNKMLEDFRKEQKAIHGNGWRVKDATAAQMRDLGQKQFEAVGIPRAVQQEYWRQWDGYVKGLR